MPIKPSDCGVSSEELMLLADDIKFSSDDEAAIACLVLIVRARLAESRERTSMNVEPLVDASNKCLQLFADAHGLCVDRIKSRVSALERAGETAAYLHSLPN